MLHRTFVSGVDRLYHLSKSFSTDASTGVATSSETLFVLSTAASVRSALSRVSRIAPSAANFLFIDLGRPNGPVNEALLARGIIVKPWKEPGFERFIRVSVGAPHELERFVAAMDEIMSKMP